MTPKDPAMPDEQKLLPCPECRGVGIIRQPDKPEDLMCGLCSGRGTRMPSNQVKYTCAHCCHPKSEEWHLVCDDCWAKIPENLQRELIASHAERVGSSRHQLAMERVLSTPGKLKPFDVFAPVKGLVHVCTVKSEDGWEAMCCLWDGERWLYWDNELEPHGWEPVTDINCVVEAWDLPCMPISGRSLTALLKEAQEAIKALHENGDFRNHNTDATDSIDEGIVQTAGFVGDICDKIDRGIAGVDARHPSLPGVVTLSGEEVAGIKEALESASLFAAEHGSRLTENRCDGALDILTRAQKEG